MMETMTEAYVLMVLVGIIGGLISLKSYLNESDEEMAP